MRKFCLLVGCVLWVLVEHSWRVRAVDSNVDLASRTNSFVVVSNDTTAVIVSSNNVLTVPTLSLVEGSADDINNFAVECEARTCTIRLTSNFTQTKVSVIFWFGVGDPQGQSLTVTVRTNVYQSCQVYPSPLPFDNTVSYNFTCTPPASLSVSRVTWRSFLREEDVEDFQVNGAVDNNGQVISSDVKFTLSGTYNHTLQVKKQSGAAAVAAFYVPSFVVMNNGSSQEIPLAETSIYVVPEITTDMPEFSFEVGLNQNFFDRIRCATMSFPAARVQWTLKSEDYPDSENLVNINDSTFALDNLGSLEALTLTFNGVVNMTNLGYEDDGNFTCNCSNRYGHSAQWARLRVKSSLRPLWPALGIIAVTIIVTLFMFGSTMVEKISEKHKKSRIGRSETDSIDHPSDPTGHRLTAMSHKTDNGSSAHKSKVKDPSHSAVTRHSSAKPLLEETTTTL